MFKVLLHIFALGCFLLPSTGMRGQGLPSFEQAKEITKGALPDGIEYCLVTNTARKGFADFALVQKGEKDIAATRALLDRLPHFTRRSPLEFLSDNGVGYTDKGYIQHFSDVTMFSFEDVPTYNQDVADSTLLLIFDIVASSRKPQAIIISGDINVAKIRERMELLSMMIPRLEKHFESTPYVWDSREQMRLIMKDNLSSDVASINVIYSTQRLSRETLGTIQPAISRAYAYELGHIIDKRVSSYFLSQGIPLAGTSYRYYDSTASDSDERYSYTVHTSARYTDSATRVIASVLSDLDSNGATVEEFVDARDKMWSEAKLSRDGHTISNKEYVRQCMASYVYGSDLASETTVNDYISSRRLSDERETELFNGFAKALIDPERNLTLRYDLPGADIDARTIMNSFRKAWDMPLSKGHFIQDYGDTLSLFQVRPRSRVKLRFETSEPISGGKLWTFSNGIKVIYRQLDTKGKFHYALMLHGGFAAVPGIQDSESAFLADMLDLSDIAGMSGRNFNAMLSANGISMDKRASLSDFCLTGVAPKTKLPLLMRSLLSIADKRQPNRPAFEYYRTGEALRIDMAALSPRDVNSLMDSIMRPNYFYTERKRMSNLGQDFPERAEQYFESIFEKVNDGVLVFIGDLDEEYLKRELCSTLGNFRTRSVIAERPRVDVKLASGSVTYTVESAPGTVGGGERGVNVAMSTAIPYSISTYVTFKLACEAIRKELTRALAPYGAYIEIDPRLEIFPQERLLLHINCRPCSEDSLPAGVSAADPLSLLEAVRTVTSRLESVAIGVNELKAYKDALLAGFETESRDAESILGNILVRYSESKDLVTGYRQAVNAVSADGIRNILSALKSGAEVEYVII